jgi:hypothetical protein
MNTALGKNNVSGPSTRMKIGKWRATSRKILLSESREHVAAPVWSSASPLTRRHGTAISRGNNIVGPGGKIGINVIAVFLDGHAEPVTEDFARNIFHIRPWAE